VYHKSLDLRSNFTKEHKKPNCLVIKNAILCYHFSLLSPLDIFIVTLRLNNMGATKTDKFTEEQNQVARMAKALAHPARIAIIQYLFSIDSCVCGDIVNEIGLAQPTISQHLKELKSVGLIKGSVEGTSVCYCINHSNWILMKNLLSPILNLDAAILNDCC
jgi:ArsR family transcriptional regulator